MSTLVAYARRFSLGARTDRNRFFAAALLVRALALFAVDGARTLTAGSRSKWASTVSAGAGTTGVF